jgi:hypothetical protein
VTNKPGRIKNRKRRGGNSFKTVDKNIAVVYYLVSSLGDWIDCADGGSRLV